MKQKIDLSLCKGWDHHRSGWKFCINCLRDLHTPYGVLLIGSTDDFMKKNKSIDRPWIGFIHNAPHHPKIMNCLYGHFHGSFDLEKMFSIPIWESNLKKCLGIFCLSEYICNFVKSRLSVPCEFLLHPTEFPEVNFSWNRFMENKNKKLIVVGHWMRNWQPIFDLEKIPFDKFILKGVGDGFDYNNIIKCFRVNSSVKYLSRLNNNDYDRCLSENLVFLNLFDSGANNTIVECIARKTPIIVNRLPSVEEYLGKDYPLFYTSLGEVPNLLSYDNIKFAHEYLQNISSKVSEKNFYRSFVDSKIYSSLPTVLI